jgi:hypothetical protein
VNGTGNVDLFAARPGSGVQINTRDGHLASSAGNGQFLSSTYVAAGINVAGSITTTGGMVRIYAGANSATANAINVGGSINTSSTIGSGGAVILMGGLAGVSNRDVTIGGTITTKGISPVLFDTGNNELYSNPFAKGGAVYIITPANVSLQSINTGDRSSATSTTLTTNDSASYGGDVIIMAGTPGGSAGTISFGNISAVGVYGGTVQVVTLGTGNITGTSIATDATASTSMAFPFNGYGGPVVLSSAGGSISITGTAPNGFQANTWGISTRGDAGNSVAGDVFLSSGASAGTSISVTNGIDNRSSGSNASLIGNTYAFYVSTATAPVITMGNSNGFVAVSGTVGPMPSTAGTQYTLTFNGGTTSQAASVVQQSITGGTPSPFAWFSPGGFTSLSNSSNTNIAVGGNTNNVIVPLVSLDTVNGAAMSSSTIAFQGQPVIGIFAPGSINVGSGVSSTVGQPITLGTKNLTVSAGTTAVLDAITDGTNVSITSVDDMTLNSMIKIAATGTLTLQTTGTGDINLPNTTVGSGAKLNVLAAGAINTGANTQLLGKTLSLAAGAAGLVSAAAVPSNATTITINTTGSVDLTDNAAAVTLGASNVGSLTLTDTALTDAITVKGPIVVTQAAGSLTIQGVSAPTPNNTSIKLAGNITAGPGATTSLTATGTGTITQTLKTALLACGTVNLTANKSIGSTSLNIIMQSAAVNANSALGSVYLTDTSAVTVAGSAVAPTQTFSLIDSGQDPSGVVPAIATAGSINAPKLILKATNPLAGSVTASTNAGTVTVNAVTNASLTDSAPALIVKSLTGGTSITLSSAGNVTGTGTPIVGGVFTANVTGSFGTAAAPIGTNVTSDAAVASVGWFQTNAGNLAGSAAAPTITLKTLKGEIGTLATPFSTTSSGTITLIAAGANSVGLVNVTNTGNVTLAKSSATGSFSFSTTGTLTVNGVTTTALATSGLGAVTLTNSSGLLQVNGNIKATGGAILIQNNDAIGGSISFKDGVQITTSASGVNKAINAAITIAIGPTGASSATSNLGTGITVLSSNGGSVQLGASTPQAAIVGPVSPLAAATVNAVGSTVSFFSPSAANMIMLGSKVLIKATAVGAEELMNDSEEQVVDTGEDADQGDVLANR